MNFKRLNPIFKNGYVTYEYPDYCEFTHPNLHAVVLPPEGHRWHDKIASPYTIMCEDCGQLLHREGSKWFKVELDDTYNKEYPIKCSEYKALRDMEEALS